EFDINENCPLCNNILMKESETFSNTKSYQKKEEIQTEQTGLNEQIDAVIVTSLINEITAYGEAVTWEHIQTIIFESRLSWVEMFFEAKKRLGLPA
ncbi:MAG TPA: hypothetical protein VGB37_07400, partial [Candidatus Lokiarchaeia archaeon]